MTGFTEADRATLGNRPCACRAARRRDGDGKRAITKLVRRRPLRRHHGAVVPYYDTGARCPGGAKFNDIKGEVHVQDAPERSRGLGMQPAYQRTLSPVFPPPLG